MSHTMPAGLRKIVYFFKRRALQAQKPRQHPESLNGGLECTLLQSAPNSPKLSSSNAFTKFSLLLNNSAPESGG